MSHLGDFDAAAVIYGKFSTYRPSTGATFTLASTPALSVYKDNSTTQSTTGVTLTADFDSVTGLNHFAIDTSADGTFYAAGSFFDIVITTGTVDSVSVTGSVVGSFTLRKNSALKPTTAARTLDVSAGGEAGVDWANVGSPTTTLNLSATSIATSQVVASVTGAVGSVTGAVGSVTGSVGSIASGGIAAASFATTAGAFSPLGVVDQGTAQSATATTLVLRSAAAFADSELVGATILITGGTGVGQSRSITAYVGSTDTATVNNWTTAPSGTITYMIFGTAASSGGSGLDAAATRAAIGLASANLDTQLSGLDTKLNTIDDFVDTEVAAIKAKTDQLTFTTTNQVDCQPISVAASAITATSIASNAITAAKIATDAITSSQLAASAVTEIQTGLSTLDAAAVRAAVGLASANLDTQLSTIDDFLDTEVAAIKAKTDQLTFTNANQVDASAISIAANAITATSIAADAITASKIATGAVDADALATDAVNEIADGVLDRNMGTGSDSGSPTVRTVRQALRACRNRVNIAAGTATIYKEDDSTASWTAAVTTTAGNPISQVDPA